MMKMRAPFDTSNCALPVPCPKRRTLGIEEERSKTRSRVRVVPFRNQVPVRLFLNKVLGERSTYHDCGTGTRMDQENDHDDNGKPAIRLCIYEYRYGMHAAAVLLLLLCSILSAKGERWNRQQPVISSTL